MSWADAEKAISDAEKDAPRKYIRLKDQGEKVVVAFVGDPLVRKVHWSERNSRYQGCEGDDCVACTNGSRPSIRATINVFLPKDGAMKIWECGSVTLQDILKVRTKYGLDKWIFEIERLGKPNDPKTKYAVLPETKIDDKLTAQIAVAKLWDLRAEITGATTKEEPEPWNKTGPIESDLAEKIAARIKSLPDHTKAIEEFRAKFGVQKIRELSVQAVPDVEAWLLKREGANGNAEDDIP